MLLDERALKVLTKPPYLRTDPDLDLLVEATRDLDYFRQLRRSSADVFDRLHREVCSHLHHLSCRKGAPVIRIDEPSDRLFILLAGGVSVYKRRAFEEVQLDRRLLALLAEHAAKCEFLGEEVRVDEALEVIEGLRAADRAALRERFARLRGTRVEYREEFFAQEVGGRFRPADLRDSPEVFDGKGVLLMECIGELAGGQAFGEKGLNERSARTATVLCHSSSHLGFVLKEDYNKVLRGASLFEDELHRKFFSETVFSRCLDYNTTARLALDFYMVKFELQPQQLVYRQGGPLDHVFVVEEGCVLLFRDEMATEAAPEALRQPAVRRQLHKLGLLGRGGLFGFEDLQDPGRRRFYSALTVSPSKLLRVTRECFERHLQAAPTLREFVRKRRAKINAHRTGLIRLQTRIAGCLRGAPPEPESAQKGPERSLLGANIRKALAQGAGGRRAAESTAQKVRRFIEAQTGPRAVSLGPRAAVEADYAAELRGTRRFFDDLTAKANAGWHRVSRNMQSSREELRAALTSRRAGVKLSSALLRRSKASVRDCQDEQSRGGSPDAWSIKPLDTSADSGGAPFRGVPRINLARLARAESVEASSISIEDLSQKRRRVYTSRK